jgi:hypothetical protein
MTTASFVIGTVVGGVTVLVTGVLLFAVPPLSAFYAYAMAAGSATNLQRDAPLLWPTLAGALSYGALVTLAIGRRRGEIGVVSAMRTGAVAGYLLWFTANAMFLAISNVGNVLTVLVGPLLELVPGACAGGTVAAILTLQRHEEPSPTVRVSYR